ncbi:response regulator [Bdellovibrio bacteriovorus]
MELKILVVDDMRSMRKIVMKALTELGSFQVSEAENGALAWELVQKAIAEGKPYNLIVSDWNMPVMKGIDLLKHVRSTPAIAKTPFYLVTAETEASQVKEAVVLGVSGYVTKPFTPAGLKEKLSKAIAQATPALKAG